ncbi:MAG: nucleotide exchange factor GrpE [Clostridia bacterium]|nr:nucleotide exchange factor GrpE [Clostridia bacterium]
MIENEKDLEVETAAEAEVTEEITEEATEATEGKAKGSDKKKIKKVEAELAETQKKLEAAEAALAEEKDKYLRMLAEYDNFRRRTAKEKETIYGDATADTVKGLLPIIDTLERAAAGLTPEDIESPLGKGITMTLKSATDALSKLSVEEVPTDTFNPDIHNAVMHVEDDSLPEGAIVAVFQKGYRRGDHIIRYAMVQVAN